MTKHTKKHLKFVGDSVIIELKVKESPMDYGIITSIIGFVASVATAWGMLQQKIKQLEERMEPLEKDRELLIRIDEKVSTLIANQQKLEERLESRKNTKK